MKKKRNVYSGLNKLPKGIAKGKPIDGCLVLEGGAFRGVYTSGVLDCLMEHEINFFTTIGVSAGAMNGICYACGNIGRAGRINLGHRHDKHYVGLKAFKKNRGIIGFDFLFAPHPDIEPLNLAFLEEGKRRFLCTATDCLTGKETIFEYGKCSNIYQAIQASASMPFVSKMVMIDSRPYLDGGCVSKIPLSWALKQDFKHIVVVKTRDRSFVAKENALTDNNAKIVYRHYPHLRDDLLNQAKETNACNERVLKLTEEGRIFTVYPSKLIEVSRLEGDMEKLGELYHQGYQDMEALLPSLKEYLSH